MSDIVLYAMYDDEEVLMNGAKKLVAEGVKVNEVFSPFPIHGLDPVIGIKETRLGIVAFLFGLGGLTLALIGMKYFMIDDFPMNIGGKPNQSLLQNLPSFIPVIFEFTVLMAAHGMAMTYFIRNGTFPGVKADNPDPRTTDDKFVMELRVSENSKFSAEDLEKMVKDTGIIELEQKELK